jgi:hypothetical protein
MTKVKSRADLIQTYIKELNEKLKRGDSTEHTHRAALQRLLEAFSDKLVVTNEPKHIKVGAPDSASLKPRDAKDPTTTIQSNEKIQICEQKVFENELPLRR